jgi:hypothetical protein
MAAIARPRTSTFFPAPATYACTCTEYLDPVASTYSIRTVAIAGCGCSLQLILNAEATDRYHDIDHDHDHDHE